MPIFDMNCTKCGAQEDILMKYNDMRAGVICKCGGAMLQRIGPVSIKGTSSDKFIMREDVGPMSKKSKAYEKKKDDEVSMDCNKPGGTFGTGGVKGFKERQIKIKRMKNGETNFTDK